MRKLNLVVLTLMCSALFAVTLRAEDEWLPKGEFTVNLFGGPTTLAGWQTAPVNAVAGFDGLTSPAPFFDAKRLAGGIGIGYIWHFNNWLGLVTGLDFSLYRDSYTPAGGGYLYGGNVYTWWPNLDPIQNRSTQWFKINGFTERAVMGAAQIPLMVQFKIPASKRVCVYANVGATLAFNVLGRYTQMSVARDTTGTPATAIRYHHDSQVITEGDRTNDRSTAEANCTARDRIGVPYTEGGWYQNGGERSGSLALNLIDVKASAELGVRWAISRSFALYTGVYLDWGLLASLKTTGSFLDNPARRAELANKANISPNVPALIDATQVWEAEGSPITQGGSVYNATGAPSLILDNGSEEGSHLTFGDPKPYLPVKNAHSCGIKLRFAFSTAHTPAPAPQPVIQYVERIVRDTVVNTVVRRDTVVNTVIQKDTVTNTVVVRDTVTVIKEVPVEIQKVMADLSNSLFDTGKSIIKDAAKGPLYTVVMWLKANPNAKVEVSGHTDNVGSASYNQKLSEDRAKAVYDYFVASGVDASRLSYAGYGMDRPVASNDTPEGRQQNRRVELNVIE